MARQTWPLFRGRPSVEIVLTFAVGRRKAVRVLLADTGAGSNGAPFELVLDENDCVHCGGNPTKLVQLTGAFSGMYPVYGVRIQMPGIGFDDDVEVVGVRKLPAGIEGIACFRFLNRFTYGNFADRNLFGLEL